jgi:hypothetical protein
MPRWLLALGLLGLVASVIVLSLRWPVESAYRDVEIVLDGPDWEALAAREGQDPLAVFAQASAHGATAVAVYERTLKRMAATGEVAYRSGGQVLSDARAGQSAPAFRDLLASGSVRPAAVYVVAPPELGGFLQTAFGELVGMARVQRTAGLLEVAGSIDDLEEAPLGYLPQDLARYTRLGLRPVLRLRNYSGLSAAGLRAKMARLAQLGAGYPVVFEQTEVLGYERLLDETAAVLRSAGFPYARIEVFTERRKQRGEDRLAALMRPNVIRLFSLTADELAAQTPEAARDKFVRAARERNIRILYLRPIPPTAGLIGTDVNMRFLERLTADLAHLGLRPGPARALPELRVPPLLMCGVILGALAAMTLTLILLGRAIGVPVPSRVVLVLVSLGILLTAATAANSGAFLLWRKLLALGTACTVPVLAIVTTMPRRHHHPVLAALRTVWAASAISLAGGFLVAALLSSWEFMMASDVFLGVKVAHLVPVVLVALVLATAERPPQHWREGAAQLWAWTSRPLLVRYAIVAVVVGVAAVIMLARSGNFGLPVSSLEERLRALAESVFVARPRTKEYLLGHPALVLAAGAAVMRWRWGVIALAAAGAIGQAGIINNFSHAHTPLLFAGWRTANALVLGSVLGVAALAVLLRVVAAFAPHPRAAPSRR